MPAHSSLQADLLLDFKRVERLYKYGSGNALTTLLQLDEHADAVEIGKAIQEMEGRYSDYEKNVPAYSSSRQPHDKPNLRDVEGTEALTSFLLPTKSDTGNGRTLFGL